MDNNGTSLTTFFMTNERGGGSGGGADRSHAISGTHEIIGGSVSIISGLGLTPEPESRITLLAVAQDPSGVGSDGTVELRGNKGVRITGGEPLGPLLATALSSTKGVEIACAPDAKITMQQGVEQVGPSMAMATGGLTIDGGLVPITIQSMTSITIQVAGGVASITLTPTGVEIKGILVNVN